MHTQAQPQKPPVGDSRAYFSEASTAEATEAINLHYSMIKANEAKYDLFLTRTSTVGPNGVS